LGDVLGRSLVDKVEVESCLSGVFRGVLEMLVDEVIV
jgi:hypothetical protein